jgi:hypothetical protein
MPTPLALVSSEVVTITPTLETPTVTITAIPVVAASVPAPTLVDGRPS